MKPEKLAVKLEVHLAAHRKYPFISIGADFR